MVGISLQAILDRAKKTDPTVEPTGLSAMTNAAPANAVSRGAREGKKLIGGHFAPEVSVQLRILAAEEATTVQNLLAEALNDLFIKKGRARIARV